jgi:hypothetical protein
MKHLGVQMHGVTLNLQCNYDRLLDHIASLLHGYTCPPWESPHLVVTGHWLSQPPQDEPGPLAETVGLDGFGKRMLLSAAQLVWTDVYRDKDLQLRFRRHGATVAFDVVYRYVPSARKLDKYPDFEAKKFFDLLRYLVLFPLAWHLERTRGWVLMHASAVATGGRAVLVAGPGGAGKTTTCVALTVRAGMALITENLLFWDGAHIFPVPEPIRLTEESLALVGADAASLQPVSFRGGLKHKALFQFPVQPTLPAVRPAVLFLPQFSRHGFVRRLPPGEACELLAASNRLTLEVNDYYWYTAALDLLWPQAGNAQRQLDVLQRLTATTPCYRLGIDRSAGVGPVVDRVLQCLHGSPETVEAVVL